MKIELCFWFSPQMSLIMDRAKELLRMHELWLADMYLKCGRLETELNKEIVKLFDLEFYHERLLEKFSDGYEHLLQGIVGKLGGHMGHYKVLAEQTEIPGMFIAGYINGESFIREIQEFIQEEELEESASLVSPLDAVGLTWNEIHDFKNTISKKLRVFTGSKEPVPFYRCDLILAELYVYLED